MYRPTDIEPVNCLTSLEQEVDARTAPDMESNFQALEERFLIVAGDEKELAQCSRFIRRFAHGPAVIHTVKLTGVNPAEEVRRLVIALEADWLCLVAQRGAESMALFLKSDVEKVLRYSPCPVICIPESFALGGGDDSGSQDSMPIRRILLPIKPSPDKSEIVERAVGIAERFRARLDLLGVEEFVRRSEGSPVVRRRDALRMQHRTIRNELKQLADAQVPQRLRGRGLVSVGFPFFYATTRSSKEQSSDLIVLQVPIGLWNAEGRIDVATERILHSARCPVICISERVQALNATADHACTQRPNHRRRRSRPMAGCQRSGSKFKRFSEAAAEISQSNVNNENRFNFYETEIVSDR